MALCVRTFVNNDCTAAWSCMRVSRSHHSPTLSPPPPIPTGDCLACVAAVDGIRRRLPPDAQVRAAHAARALAGSVRAWAQMADEGGEEGGERERRAFEGRGGCSGKTMQWARAWRVAYHRRDVARPSPGARGVGATLARRAPPPRSPVARGSSPHTPPPLSPITQHRRRRCRPIAGRRAPAHRRHRAAAPLSPRPSARSRRRSQARTARFASANTRPSSRSRRLGSARRLGSCGTARVDGVHADARAR